MFLLFTSFVAGILTILTPCVLPVLPIILGGSISSSSSKNAFNYSKIVIITSLIFSIVLFTLLLKFSAVMLNVSEDFWTIISGSLVILLGLTYIFPKLWGSLFLSSWLRKAGNKINSNRNTERQVKVKNILTGLALGPVFTSCSPTYFLILAVVLPTSLSLGVLYLFAYSIGLGLSLYLVSILGEKLLEKLNYMNQSRNFKIAIGVMFIVVGVFIVTGLDKRLESKIVQPKLVQNIETKLLENKNLEQEKQKLLEIKKENNLNSNMQIDNKNENTKIAYENFGTAPELTGIVGFINVAENTTLQSILAKNKVVMLEFWTYSCINCKHTLPYVNSWYDKYHDKGFEIVGVHTPEFAFEKKKENIAQAAKELGVQFPIFMDNDYATWNAYNNRYWPMRILIIPTANGNQIIYQHAGEGDYERNEEIIKQIIDN